MKIPTQLVHNSEKNTERSLHTPLYLNASFEADSPEELQQLFENKGQVYARLQNPSCQTLEQRLAQLTGAKMAIVTNTGMSAVTGLLLTVAYAGAHIVASPTLFSGTLKHLRAIFPKFGVEVSFCDLNDLNALDKAMRKETCMVFGEILGNPALSLLDVPHLAEYCEQKAVPLFLDATMTPPLSVDLSRWSIAAAIHSTTKYIMGNGSLLGGLFLDWDKYNWEQAKDGLLKQAAEQYEVAPLAQHFRTVSLHTAGFTQQPFAAAMHEIQLETLAIRYQRQCQNAATLAKLLSESSVCSSLAYLGLEEDPYHLLAKKIFNQNLYGSLIAFDLGSKERAFRFLHALKLAKHMTNLGDLRTLIIHPASTMYHACSEEERQLAGVTQGLLRLSVGIEDIDDLLEDFSYAIQKIKGAKSNWDKLPKVSQSVKQS